MSYCIYLRKSRADIDLEKEGRNETLKRHRTILLKFAYESGLFVTKIREEIASGESISHRPEMLKLLEEVRQKKYIGVIVMDVDRLGRGNMREQGMILETFKSSKTMIITPRKTYDLDNEFDEEYSEFAAFMARKELKLINRRLMQGRLKSVEDGNYIAPLPPYGYVVEKKKNGKRTLTPNPEQAAVVKLIFSLYADSAIGSKKIAARLNEMALKTYTGKEWDGSSVLTILKNSAYAGRTEWRKKIYKKSIETGKRTVTKNDEDNRVIVPNTHEALISDELFERVQKKLKSRRQSPYKKALVNPFAGLVFCAGCSSPMVYRNYPGKLPRLICPKSCGMKSTIFSPLEEIVLSSAQELLAVHINLGKHLTNNRDSERLIRYDTIISSTQKELRQAEAQKEALHCLLERGQYDFDTYTERMSKLSSEIERLNIGINVLLDEKAVLDCGNKSKSGYNNIFDVYGILETAEQKNRFLKTFIEKIEYNMPKSRCSGDFDLIIRTKI